MKKIKIVTLLVLMSFVSSCVYTPVFDNWAKWSWNTCGDRKKLWPRYCSALITMATFIPALAAFVVVDIPLAIVEQITGWQPISDDFASKSAMVLPTGDLYYAENGKEWTVKKINENKFKVTKIVNKNKVTCQMIELKETSREIKNVSACEVGGAS